MRRCCGVWHVRFQIRRGGAETRALLRARFASPKARGLKELLADAPLDGIDLDRSDDLGREVEL